MIELAPGDLVWLDPGPPIGREQAGRRPALVVASADYLGIVETLALIVPITGIDRGWPNHVPVGGLSKPSWAMTEQIRTVSRERIASHIGRTDPQTLAAVRQWLGDFLALG